MVSSVTMSLLIAIFSIIVGCYIYVKHFLYTFWDKKGVFCVKPTFPVGNIGKILMGKMSPGVLYDQLYHKYKHKRFFGVYQFSKPFLVICDPDLVRSVLLKDFIHFTDRGVFYDPKIDPLNDNLFHMGGIRWKNMRTRLTPTFTSGKVKQMFSIMQNYVLKMADHLEEYADRNRVVEIKELSARVSTDVIVSIAFGIESNCLENPDSEFRYWGKKLLQPNFWRDSLLVFAPFIMENFKIPKTNPDVTKFFTKTIKDTIEYRLTNNVTRPDFMNLLIQLVKRGYVDNDDGNVTDHSEKNGDKITTEEAIAQAFVFFIAGFETTSSTIAFCLYELARSCNEDIQEKVRAEIDTVVGNNNGQLTYELIGKMPYLHKILLETLRKYPALPLYNRRCTKDIQLPGTNLKIYEGMDVIIPTLGLQTDPDFFPDPMKFDPERFNEENSATRHPSVNIPFGDGPRYCIGSRFGILEAKLVVINIISRYKLSMGPKTPEPIPFAASALLLIPGTGIDLRIEHRITKTKLKL